MAGLYTPVPADPEVIAQRTANQKVVESYLSISGAENYEARLALMADDILYEIVNTMENKPKHICGIDMVREKFIVNAHDWGEFEYKNVVIHATQNPELFIVNTDGVGTMTNMMWSEPRPYMNYYWIHIRVRGGKIDQFRQFSNPYKLLHDFWKDMPDYVV